MKWPSEAIWETVVSELPGFTVEILPHIDSTNSELMRRAKAGQTEPLLLVAEHQTAGRGRLGREWLDQGSGAQTQALMFSLGLRLSPANWSGLSLAVGISVAQSLHPDLRLKWPNDIWLNNRKLAGILIETIGLGVGIDPGSGNAADRSRYAVIGVGINITAPDPTGLSTPAAWLQEVLPGIDAAAALQRIVLPLVQTLQQFDRQGFAPFQARFTALDALLGRPIAVNNAGAAGLAGSAGVADGMASGVDELGALLVHTGAGVAKITSSEVSVRPLEPTNLPC
jgi:BirA family transcriptional regulator, biotin operon repressor / biotin---[acetyl-CoA-carboxylase] ligase